MEVILFSDCSLNFHFLKNFCVEKKAKSCHISFMSRMAIYIFIDFELTEKLNCLF